MMERLKTEKETIMNLIKENRFGFGLNEKDKQNLSIYINITYILAKVYMRVDWKKIIHGNKIRSEDVFQHRIKSSANRISLRLVLDKLCNSLGLQSIEVLTNIIDDVVNEESKALWILRKESIYLSRKAIELSELLWKNRRCIKDENKKI